MSQPIIQFENFTFKYESQAEPTLKNINLSIYQGEKVLIVGPSGSGKSTLANCINGMVPFSYPGESSGKLTVSDMEVKNHSLFDLSQVVGTVLQDPDGQFIGLTVSEDIAFSLENACVKQDEMKKRTLEAASIVNINTHLEYSPQALSGGQKQRVSMAGVMVDNVPVLLFDEPLANLDPATGKQAIALIDKIQKESNITVIIIEHRLEDVLYRPVDRIIVVDKGEITADMHPHELISSNILKDTGIREPLYVTALKYAGVPVDALMMPAYIDTIYLSDDNKSKVSAWFRDTSPPSPPNHNDPLLKIENLSFSYDEKHVVTDDVSFTINKGEIVSIVGANGAGKSTLSKLICGFEKPTAGTIYLSGRDLSEDTITKRAKNIGYVMQNPNQMICKTMIFDEVALALQKSGTPEAEIKERVEDTLKICGLYKFRNWPISALSFGQKKRVTIASVLAMRPDIIILDEPTAGQDFRHYTDIMSFLEELNRLGVTIIMITHDMHLMLEYAPRALVFSSSKLVADSTAAEVLTNSDLATKASLKETSLYQLAQICGIEAGTAFVQHFIDFDREVRLNEQQ